MGPNLDNGSERFPWAELLQSIYEGQVVPIVGQDLLQDELGKLYYEQVAIRLAARLGVQEKLTGKYDVNTVALRYLQQGNKKTRVYYELSEVISELGVEPYGTHLDKLSEIEPLMLFVTTTYDSLLEQSLNHVRNEGQQMTKVISYAPNLFQDLNNGYADSPNATVFQLFGKASSQPYSYAATHEDLLEFIHSHLSERNRPNRLFDELSRKNLLFLGCNFGGWLAKLFIRIPKSGPLRNSGDRVDYFADSEIKGDDDLALFIDQFSASAEIYKLEGPIQFIDELHRRWKEKYGDLDKRRPEDIAAVLQQKCQPGAVFISYAKEDRAFAIELAGDLEGSVEVFFDREILRAGDPLDVVLKRTIKESSVFIPVISKASRDNAMADRYFWQEWNWAHEQAGRFSDERRFILPIKIENVGIGNVPVPESFEKPIWTDRAISKEYADFLEVVKELYREDQIRRNGK